MEEVFIVSVKRSAVGSFLGALSSITAPQLGGQIIKDVYSSINLDPTLIESVYFGNVLSANLGQSPARHAALLAGLPDQADCTTINKVCSSGLKALVMGAQQIQLGLEDLMITGGMESMSNAPHYSLHRKIHKLGDDVLIDGILKDGLTDAILHYHMGYAAELCVEEFKISRTEQDDYALASYEKANSAIAKGKFKNEITPIVIGEKNGSVVFDKDEDVAKIIHEKVPHLKPVFKENGTITAANASNINDGAAALLLASKKAVEQYHLKPIAKVIAYADAAQAPEKFTTSPSVAISKVLQKAHLSLQDIDFIEINEAYAAVMIANQKILGLDMSKVNPYGGAIAIGHPLGASGARILCTLTSVLQQESGKYGLAAICNGGGGATAVLIENLQF